VFAGVYTTGRPHVTRDGYLMAAVLASGDGAALADFSAAEHYRMVKPRPGPIHVAVPHARAPRTRGIKVHRRMRFDVRIERGIPATSPICTVIDLSRQLPGFHLERVINEAVNRDLIDLDELREAARGRSSAIGRRLERDSFVVTDTVLEQRFLRIVRRTSLPLPETQVRLPGGRVDFYWPELQLVVEADSLRFHRTPFQQRSDALRDQTHFKSRLRTLRFTHWQICREPEYVESVLRAA
jgi:very-short-patch-repair endonuclease